MASTASAHPPDCGLRRNQSLRRPARFDSCQLACPGQLAGGDTARCYSGPAVRSIGGPTELDTARRVRPLIRIKTAKPTLATWISPPCPQTSGVRKSAVTPEGREGDAPAGRDSIAPASACEGGGVGVGRGWLTRAVTAVTCVLKRGRRGGGEPARGHMRAPSGGDGAFRPRASSCKYTRAHARVRYYNSTFYSEGPFWARNEARLLARRHRAAPPVTAGSRDATDWHVG